MNEIESAVREILEENGVILLSDFADDDLQEAVEDSITLISIVLGLEERFGITFPAENISLDLLSSFRGLCELVSSLVSPAICPGENSAEEVTA